MKQRPVKARLVLEDGKVFEGFSFGKAGNSAGEVVFNTAMTGYPESLTDPSYEGQILVTTFPLQGNYGVPPASREERTGGGLSDYLESERIHVKGLVVQDYSWENSHWLSDRSLDAWLRDEGIPGIYGVDTRALTKHLRHCGSMLGKILAEGVGEDTVEWYDPNLENLVAKASCPDASLTLADMRESKDGAPADVTPDKEEGAPRGEEPHRKKVVLVDCGVKHNIVRCLSRRGVDVLRVPWDYDYTGEDFDGVFISNGPGNPDMAEKTVEILRKVMTKGKPICGICMGNQLLAKAAGARTYKLPFGHRSHNQPVRRVGSNECFITSQNHGFAVDDKTLPDEWEPLFVNLNDGTNEGIRHKTMPWFSAQFHPEASSGPKDTEFLFDEFVKLL